MLCISWELPSLRMIKRNVDEPHGDYLKEADLSFVGRDFCGRLEKCSFWRWLKRAYQQYYYERCLFTIHFCYFDRSYLRMFSVYISLILLKLFLFQENWLRGADWMTRLARNKTLFLWLGYLSFLIFWPMITSNVLIFVYL